MNRRALMIGMTAMVPAVSMAQDATPEMERGSGSILRQYLNEVWIKGNADAIADFFDADDWDLLDVQREHRIIIDGLAEQRPLHIETITSDPMAAMAYCILRLADGDEYDMFMGIWLNDSGLISAYRWMSQPHR